MTRCAGRFSGSGQSGGFQNIGDIYLCIAGGRVKRSLEISLTCWGPVGPIKRSNFRSHGWGQLSNDEGARCWPNHLVARIVGVVGCSRFRTIGITSKSDRGTGVDPTQPLNPINPDHNPNPHPKRARNGRELPCDVNPSPVTLTRPAKSDPTVMWYSEWGMRGWSVLGSVPLMGFSVSIIISP